MNRQVKITTFSNILMVEFLEGTDRGYTNEYHMYIDPAQLMTVEILNVFQAWLEKDDVKFSHSEIIISGLHR